MWELHDILCALRIPRNATLSGCSKLLLMAKCWWAGIRLQHQWTSLASFSWSFWSSWIQRTHSKWVYRVYSLFCTTLARLWQQGMQSHDSPSFSLLINISPVSWLSEPCCMRGSMELTRVFLVLLIVESKWFQILSMREWWCLWCRLCQHLLKIPLNQEAKLFSICTAKQLQNQGRTKANISHKNQEVSVLTIQKKAKQG